MHRATYVLLVLVPLMGYSMSSSFTMSDGIPFFGAHLPELLPKNDKWFIVFQWLHKTLAYTLLGLVALHVVGALKHRFLDHALPLKDMNSWKPPSWRIPSRSHSLRERRLVSSMLQLGRDVRTTRALFAPHRRISGHADRDQGKGRRSKTGA
ncbi:cytochrome b [Achromobacter dolens]|uniref:cytochrome b n=1 Tax=Achromobacter dolens TaxID=1287738 RepID=UPI0020C5EBCE|nr:cytochrome b/b6 domain-containing protein [Achromobacter dolens]